MKSLRWVKVLVFIVVLSFLLSIHFSTSSAALEHRVRVIENPTEHLDG